MFRFEGRGFRFTLPLAFVSQLTSTALLQGAERPRVHLLFIVKGSLMIYCSTDYKSDFMFKETVFCYRVIEGNGSVLRLHVFSNVRFFGNDYMEQ